MRTKAVQPKAGAVKVDSMRKQLPSIQSTEALNARAARKCTQTAQHARAACIEQLEIAIEVSERALFMWMCFGCIFGV